MSRLLPASALLLLLSGCARQSLLDVATALNERHVSHCLFVQGAVPPYGTAYLYAQVGALDCPRLWQERTRATLP